jgi:hypothetical protein
MTFCVDTSGWSGGAFHTSVSPVDESARTRAFAPPPEPLESMIVSQTVVLPSIDVR